MRAATTRDQLIEAGLRLAERTGLAGMSVNLIVDEARVAKGTFFHHFGDRVAFLVALHREFHDRLFSAITSSVADVAVGRRRLIASSDTYLDICLQHRGVRALLLEARGEPAIAEEIAQRNEQARRFLSADFAALGWENPAMGAALWNGLVVEAALLELASGRRRPAVRKALAHFLPDH